jgi:4-hydroxy-3-methylbut-2-en-1-yl diphosphate synthase IspG/GcpE
MAKKPTRSKVVKKLDAVFSQYIRLRDSVNEISTCFTCGKTDHWKKLQNGHFMSRRHYSTRWDETNCQVQCAGCNVFRYGEQYKFSIGLDQKYGEGTADEMLQQSKQIIKLSTEELEDLINKYKMLVDSF